MNATRLLAAVVVAVGAAFLLGNACGSELRPPIGRPVPTTTPTPPEGKLLRFAVVGDFGTGDDVQRAVARRMCDRMHRRSFELVVTTGDNVYPDGDPDRFQDAFFEPYRCLLRAGVRFRAVLGNHDVMTRSGRPQLREPAFGMKARNYVVRKRGVRFVMVDSNDLDREVLRANLRAEAGDLWTVVVMHHPVYSPGTGHGSTPGFETLPRMFARRGVDLVLSGHDHLYAVSKPLRGIRYVVTGGGGAGLYGCRAAWFSARCVPRHHFLEVAAAADELVVRAIPPRGRAFHTFRIPQVDR